MLAGLAPVRELALVSAEQDRLVVALTLGTGVDRLQSALGLERELRAEGQVPIAYQGRGLGGLHYRWTTAEPRSCALPPASRQRASGPCPGGATPTRPATRSAARPAAAPARR